jgi:hypothetical protein
MNNCKENNAPWEADTTFAGQDNSQHVTEAEVPIGL